MTRDTSDNPVLAQLCGSMAEYDITRKSRPVIITPYDERWPTEFTEFARRIRAIAGSAAIRIDHIGSTAVPGLAAKDVIDMQVTIADLDRGDEVTDRIRR